MLKINWIYLNIIYDLNEKNILKSIIFIQYSFTCSLRDIKPENILLDEEGKDRYNYFYVLRYSSYRKTGRCIWSSYVTENYHKIIYYITRKFVFIAIKAFTQRSGRLEITFTINVKRYFLAAFTLLRYKMQFFGTTALFKTYT